MVQFALSGITLLQRCCVCTQLVLAEKVLIASVTPLLRIIHRRISARDVYHLTEIDTDTANIVVILVGYQD